MNSILFPVLSLYKSLTHENQALEPFESLSRTEWMGFHNSICTHKLNPLPENLSDLLIK